MRGTTDARGSGTYYRHSRPEMLPFLPAKPERVLELGCAEGGFLAAVKQRTGAEVWGIELNDKAAETARAGVDRILIGDANERIRELPDRHFDLIICNDVLEHLVDPQAILIQLRPKLVSNGVLVASIPNIRYAWALSKILLHKDFPQDDEGIFDRTHLRYFTRKSIVRLFEAAGFKVHRIKGINARYRPLSLLLAIGTFGYFADGFYLQYACVASVRANGGNPIDWLRT